MKSSSIRAFSAIGKIDYTFTGQRENESTGLIAFPARFYDPKVSRWLSVDPILGDYLGRDISKLPGTGGMFNPVNLNPYHYANNSPIMYVDPNGKEAVTISATGATIVIVCLGASFIYTWNYAHNPQFRRAQNSFWNGLGSTIADTTGWVWSNTAGRLLNKESKKSATLTTTTITVARPITETELENLTIKMTKEIARIKTRRLTKKTGYQYAIVAKFDGEYLDVRKGTVTLKAGDVWKYGESTNLEDRYSQVYLEANNLEIEREYFGTQEQIKIQEKIKLYGYFFKHGELPPGNKIFR